jgi:hypothetical protein
LRPPLSSSRFLHPTFASSFIKQLFLAPHFYILFRGLHLLPHLSSNKPFLAPHLCILFP